MRRLLALALPLIALAAPTTHADDNIPADTVVAVKHATVFIRVEGANWKGSGSGFVIHVNKDTALIATNAHVVAGSDFEKSKLGPAAFLQNFKRNTITAIFDSGTKTEVSVKAELIAADQERDLAIIRVTGLKNSPTAIAYSGTAAPVETMSIVTFGYPLGDALAVGKGNPTVTVGKGSVSSLRNDDDGELKLIQIDASVNPGNSGGPVVDTKGNLVGVVVSGYRGAQGLNFAIPAAELSKMMRGRLDDFKLTATKAADGSLAIKAEVGVLDPTVSVRSGTLYYVIVPPKGTKPKAGESLEKFTDAKKVTLKIENGLATGDLKLDKPEGDLFVQAIPDTGMQGATRVQNYSLTLPKNLDGAFVLGTVGSGPGAGEADPPAGWKEHTASNRMFKVWIPEKCNFSEKNKVSTSGAVRFSLHTIVAEQAGKSYIVEQLSILGVRRPDSDEMLKILREIALGDSPNAKVVKESDVTMGKYKGKEWVIESGKIGIRARGFVIGGTSFLLVAIGPRAAVEGEDSTTFLGSCRFQIATQPPVRPGQPGQPGQPAEAIAGGAATDTQFADLALGQSRLVGFEVAMGEDDMKNPVVRAIRPVYRTDDKQTLGEWQGNKKGAKELVKVTAKSGYAVSALTVKPGTNVLGFSITFMKIAGDKLNPLDSYQSDWVGKKDGPGALPITVGGKTEYPRALIGRTNATGITGLGLKYPETAAPPVAVAPQPLPPNKAGERGPRIQGGSPLDPESRDGAPANGLLVGFEYQLGKFVNNDTIAAVRPIYRVGEKESTGESFGKGSDRTGKVVAKAGYAVGSMSVRNGAGIDGFSVTFMKVTKDGKLDPNDKYDSDWIGGPGGFQTVRVGDGTPVVGLLVKVSEHWGLNGLGLIYTDTNKPGLDAPWPKGTPSKIQGGRHDPEFREAGPDGSLLVGMEVGVGQFANKPVIKSMRPIFLAGDKETTGEWYGPTDKQTVKEVVKVVAKPGYAVGAITVKTGLGVNGFSVTFMKVKDGKLDSSDKYESDWLGMTTGAQATLGDGNAPVIGLIGKASTQSLSGLGLLFPVKK